MVSHGRLAAPEFRRLAVREARRYGSDDWVFLRELIQNSRDAGATSVEFTTGVSGDTEWVSCRDDGSGMAWDEAQRHLLTLYSSRKRSDAAGRFGVGFWSVLRFEPERLVIRSRPIHADVGWELRLSGDLASVATGPWHGSPGTEVVLERRRTTGGLGRTVRRTVAAEARHCRRLGASEAVLDISVDGERIAEALPDWAPGLRFAAPGVRGVVGFAGEPSVDLLSHGLRVRRFASLDELRSPGQAARRGPTSVGSGLRIILDCDRLGVLMSRRDVAEDPEVERAVRAAERAVERLVRRTAAPSVRARLASTVRRALRHRVSIAILFVALTAAAVGLGARMGLGIPASFGDAGEARAVADAAASPLRLSGLASRYRGPGIAPVPRRPQAPGIRYVPGDVPQWFGAFRITGIGDEGRPVVSVAGAPPARPPGDASNAVSVRLDGPAWQGRTRIPLPTGTTVVGGSVLGEGVGVPVAAAGDGDVWVELPEDGVSSVEYRVVPSVSVGPSGPWPDLGVGLREVALESRERPLDETIRRCSAAIAERIEYRQGVEPAERLAEARLAESSVCRAAEIAGVGDCDVINTVLASMLHEAGYPVRLAVGWTASNGAANPGLHAWVEVDQGGGRWLVADATRGRIPVDAESAPSGELHGRHGTAGVSGAPVGASRALATGGAAAVLIVAVGLWIAGRRHAGVRIGAVVPGGRRELADLVAERLQGGSSRSSWWLDREPVIPCRNRRAVAPRALDEMAARGTVAVSASDIGRRLRWPVILDGADPVGRAAATAVDALDLDAWTECVSRADQDALCRRVNRVLDDAGAGMRVGLVNGLGVDLQGTPLPVPDGVKWCLVDRSEAWWQGLVDLAAVQPARAAVLAVLRVAETLGPGSREAFAVRQRALRDLERPENADG
jgi:hypothetical protein